MNITHLQTRLYLAAVAILLAGAVSVVAIYLSAEEAVDSTMISDFLNSKRYLHDVKSYGGNASVLADQFSRWFNDLWHGETLAFTVATIAVACSLLLCFVGYHSPPGPTSETREDNRAG